MRICLDLRWARPGRPDGIGTYVSQLAREIVTLPGEGEWTLLVDSGEAARDLGALPRASRARVRILQTRIRLLSIADWLSLPRWLGREGIELFHSPHFLVSPLPRAFRTVATVPDLIPLSRDRDTDAAGIRWRLFFANRWLSTLCLRRANGIIAISEATRRELASLLGIRKGVEVVPLGVQPENEWKCEAEPGRATRDLLLPTRYLLYVGRQDPHKKLDTLLCAYARLAPGLRDSHPLVVCGPTDPRFHPSILKLAETLGIAPNVRFLGTLSRGDLAAVYRNATLLVHPSRQEGFGLTVLEAMSFGLAVLALRIPAIEELTAGAARLVDPGGDEEADLARGMVAILSDAEERGRLGAAGRVRAALYTWRRSAEATLRFYGRILAEGGHGADRH